MERKEISKSVLKRLPGYLSYLKSLPEGTATYISATALANALTCSLSVDEMNLLGVILTQLGDTILTIATCQSTYCEQK